MMNERISKAAGEDDQDRCNAYIYKAIQHSDSPSGLEKYIGQLPTQYAGEA